jgi:hypothetical protein
MTAVSIYQSGQVIIRVLGLLVSFLCVCEFTGWNLDNFVMFSPVALWLVLPALILTVGFIGGLDFYRYSQAAKVDTVWCVRRHVNPRKWKWQLIRAVLSAILLLGGTGVYVVCWASMLLPSELEVHPASVTYRDKVTKRAPPVCREHVFLRSATLGEFHVCLSKPRGRKIDDKSKTSLQKGALVNVTVRRSALSVWAISLHPVD